MSALSTMALSMAATMMAIPQSTETLWMAAPSKAARSLPSARPNLETHQPSFLLLTLIPLRLKSLQEMLSPSHTSPSRVSPAPRGYLLHDDEEEEHKEEYSEDRLFEVAHSPSDIRIKCQEEDEEDQQYYEKQYAHEPNVHQQDISYSQQQQ
ncbi:hypothetical protein NDU88_005204 [Pleurodeles waltl]|uniref:Uncharacterized protein n=1 Tax=Pleurodeles waltl TaxID=8319 RepID=A0AAV7L013_PLEWA|nr:hypothetical protein NDU88_005204 [Pleurodeles waltl]